MSDTKKQEKGVNTVAAAIGGAIIGAGVAVAGVMLLKDEKNRSKVTDALTHVKDHAAEIIENMQQQVQQGKKELHKKLED